MLVDDSLFATLDPAVRKARTPSGWPYTLTDTVGFVRHLPHQLVDAFRSTLEEVADADLILHVVDGADADPRSQLAAVREVLAEVGAGDVPELVVINKADSADAIQTRGPAAGRAPVGGRVGMDGRRNRRAASRDRAAAAARSSARSVSSSRTTAVTCYLAHDEGEVLTVEHGGDGTELTAKVPLGLAAELDRFVRTNSPA